MVKIAIIGCGKIAKFHIPALQKSGFSIVAISGRINSYNKLLKFSKINNISNSKIFSRSDELIHSKIWDSLLICCPTKNSLKYLKIANRYKKPILIEKPVDYESKKLLPFLKSQNIKVGFNRRFYKSAKFAKKFYKSNSISLIKVSIPEKNNKFSNSKKFPLSIYENSIHMFDLLNYISDGYSFNYCKSFFYKKKLKTIISTGNTKNGSLVQLDICFNSSDNFSIDIIADKKRIKLSPIEVARYYNGMKIIDPTKNIPIRRYDPIIRREVVSTNKYNLKPGFYEQAKDFYNFCENKPSEGSSIKDVYNSIKSLEHLFRLQKNNF